jgi:hypothetical protein
MRICGEKVETRGTQRKFMGQQRLAEIEMAVGRYGERK